MIDVLPMIKARVRKNLVASGMVGLGSNQEESFL
jgi:hypothetical protein